MDETTDAKIKVLVVEPLKEPYVREISGLDDMQAIVGGHIEAAYPFPDDNVAVVCNESGKIMGLPANRPIMDESGLIPKDLNPLNSKPLLAYTRQWDKLCDSSYFTVKNAEILSYFLVLTLLETAFMQ